MCGIFGFILNEPLQDKEIAEGLSHTKSLSHRGPDHVGSWFNKEEETENSLSLICSNNFLL